MRVVPGLEARAYCDDLACATSELTAIAHALPLIDAFNQASGSESNPKKLYLLSRSPPAHSNLRFNCFWVALIWAVG
jgi:hypothetical protein